MDLDLSSRNKWIAVDMLGGDAVPGTERGGYSGDAAPNNNAAWEQFLIANLPRLVSQDVGFVLLGRPQELNASLGKVRDSGRVGYEDFESFIRVMSVERQADMKSSSNQPGTAIDVMSEVLKRPEVVADFSNGSTAFMGRSHMRQADAEKGTPFIAREIVPGVWIGDLGFRAEFKAKNYQPMFRTLHEAAGKERPKVSILPDDNLPETEIRESISGFATEAGLDYQFVDFDVLAFLGLRGEKPDVILGNGFSGNIYLKAIEAFLKEKKRGLPKLIWQDRQAMMGKIWPLVSSQEGLQLQHDIYDLEARVLSNGTEASKGTKALRNFKEEHDLGYLEPGEFIDHDGPALVTPATAKIMKGFFRSRIFKLSTIAKLPGIRRAQKSAVGIARLQHIKSGEVWIGHGKAKTEDTLQALEYLHERYR